MRKIQILLVEDNEGDILLTTEALEALTVQNEIKVVKTGKDAMEYMAQSGRFSEVQLPDLVLLDINLPIKNGIEVLSMIKSQEKTKNIPVIMLTTSSSKSDRDAAEKLNANLFISKPSDMYAYEEIVGVIDQFILNQEKVRS
jgi:two-component system, chemotaxis family, response regulator Rcp1